MNELNAAHIHQVFIDNNARKRIWDKLEQDLNKLVQDNDNVIHETHNDEANNDKSN